MKHSFIMRHAKLICLFTATVFATGLSAHATNYALEGVPKSNVFWYYFDLGFRHILPLGLDHILFVVSLFLLSPKLKEVIWQASAFTVAHTITLIWVMQGTIDPPADIVEPIISLSIAIVALENIFFKRLSAWRLLIVFGFGLIHGMGFAGALGEFGLPRDSFYYSLITFNIGVEFGQLAVILACWLLFGAWFSSKTWYRPRVVYPMSAAIVLMAGWWTVERIWGI
jgi:HupE / UreJ protein